MEIYQRATAEGSVATSTSVVVSRFQVRRPCPSLSPFSHTPSRSRSFLPAKSAVSLLLSAPTVLDAAIEVAEMIDHGLIPGAFRHRARALYTERLAFVSIYIDGLPITMTGRSVYPAYLALTDTWSACVKSRAPKMIAVGFVPLGHAAHLPRSQQARARRTLISMFFQLVLHSLRDRACARTAPLRAPPLTASASSVVDCKAPTDRRTHHISPGHVIRSSGLLRGH